MSYIVGSLEVSNHKVKKAYPEWCVAGAFGALGWTPPSPSQVAEGVQAGASKMLDTTETVAAALTPTGLLWAAPVGVQQHAGRVLPGGVKQGLTDAQQRVSTGQGYLMQLGLYPGPVSGIVDSNTQAALDRFRTAVGRPVGVADVTDADIVAMQMAVAQMQSPANGEVVGPGGAVPAMPSNLPPWLLPVGLGLGAFALINVMRKKG